jgi:hypothetical protein
MERSVRGPKVFRFWHGRNKFCCDGKFILGPDYYKAIISFFLILIPMILFFAVPCSYFIREQGNPAPLILGILLMTLSLAFLVICALTDPGFLPSQAVPELSRGPKDASLTPET